MHDLLLNLIIKKVILSDNDKGLCRKYFEPVLFPKNRIIEHGFNFRRSNNRT